MFECFLKAVFQQCYFCFEPLVFSECFFKLYVIFLSHFLILISGLFFELV